MATSACAANAAGTSPALAGPDPAGAAAATRHCASWKVPSSHRRWGGRDLAVLLPPDAHTVVGCATCSPHQPWALGIRLCPSASCRQEAPPALAPYSTWGSGGLLEAGLLSPAGHVWSSVPPTARERTQEPPQFKQPRGGTSGPDVGCLLCFAVWLSGVC